MGERRARRGRYRYLPQPLPLPAPPRRRAAPAGAYLRPAPPARPERVTGAARARHRRRRHLRCGRAGGHAGWAGRRRWALSGGAGARLPSASARSCAGRSAGCPGEGVLRSPAVRTACALRCRRPAAPSAAAALLRAVGRLRLAGALEIV